ncbi:MAG: hypothetical protein PHW52_01275 [Candidatus Pacebacteria bacterium]|nr:hypothetical protein [Candidatus Paceibacterota bacterium]
MSDKKIDQTKDELIKEIDSVKEELDTRNDIIHEIDEVKEDIAEMKEDLIEEIKADDLKAEKKNKGLKTIFIAVCIIAVVIVGAVFYNKNGGFSFGEKSVPKEEAVNKAFEFIKKYLAPGMDLKIGKIEEKKFTFYKFTVKAGEQDVPTYISVDGKTMVFQETDISKDPYAAKDPATNTDGAANGSTEQQKIDGKNVISSEGGFQEVEGGDVCKENGKPIVYFFGSKTCPHCEWQKPVIENAVKSFSGKIAFHENIDNENDIDVFNKFNTSGGIPTIVIGCKYFRVGSGEGSGEDADKKTIETLINNVLK